MPEPVTFRERSVVPRARVRAPDENETLWPDDHEPTARIRWVGDDVWVQVGPWVLRLDPHGFEVVMDLPFMLSMTLATPRFVGFAASGTWGTDGVVPPVWVDRHDPEPSRYGRAADTAAIDGARTWWVLPSTDNGDRTEGLLGSDDAILALLTPSWQAAALDLAGRRVALLGQRSVLLARLDDLDAATIHRLPWWRWDDLDIAPPSQRLPLGASPATRVVDDDIPF